MPYTIGDKDFEIIQHALAASNTLAATSGAKTLAERAVVTDLTHEGLGRLAVACPTCPPPAPPPVKNPLS